LSEDINLKIPTEVDVSETSLHHHFFDDAATATTTASASSEMQGGMLLTRGSGQGLTAQMLQNSGRNRQRLYALTDDLNHVAIKLPGVTAGRCDDVRIARNHMAHGSTK
jgi:hypothetical protein